MEKNMKKNIYVYLNHFSVHQKLTQHCKSTALQWKKKKQEHFNLMLQHDIAVDVPKEEMWGES